MLKEIEENDYKSFILIFNLNPKENVTLGGIMRFCDKFSKTLKNAKELIIQAPHLANKENELYILYC